MSHCGTARKAFNEELAQVRRCLDQRDAERSYAVPHEQLTQVPVDLADAAAASGTRTSGRSRRARSRDLVQERASAIPLGGEQAANPAPGHAPSCSRSPKLAAVRILLEENSATRRRVSATV